jgi:hypothetical protein
VPVSISGTSSTRVVDESCRHDRLSSFRNFYEGDRLPAAFASAVISNAGVAVDGLVTDDLNTFRTFVTVFDITAFDFTVILCTCRSSFMSFKSC